MLHVCLFKGVNKIRSLTYSGFMAGLYQPLCGPAFGNKSPKALFGYFWPHFSLILHQNFLKTYKNAEKGEFDQRLDAENSKHCEGSFLGIF